MDYYEIPTWRDYQHYKDRDPPWIKLHFSLMTSPTWVMLDDASRVLAIASMLIASRNHGKVPADPAYIKRVAYLSSADFTPLLSCGFLKVSSEMLANASTLQAKATTEERREEKNTSVSSEKIAFDGMNFIGLNGHIEAWKKAYPKVDVAAEVAKAEAWYLANPTKQKKNHARFLNGWLSRATPQVSEDEARAAMFAGGW